MASSTSRREALHAGSIVARVPAITEKTRKAATWSGGTSNLSRPCSRSAVVNAQPQKMPTPRPTMPPITAMMIDSPRTIRRTCARDIPTTRRSPSSRVRSYTDNSRVLMIPSTAMISDRISNATRTETNWSTVPSCMSSNWERVLISTFGKLLPRDCSI